LAALGALLVLALVGPSQAGASVGVAGTESSSTPTSAPVATSTPVATPTPTAVFARMAHSKLDIHFPATSAKLIAVGFHQASNRKAVLFQPKATCYRIYAASKTKSLLKNHPKVKMFQQPLRGRGDSNFTAADCAMPRKSVALSPVSGVVTSVKRYKLYGYVDDLRLEIKPNGAPHYRVVMLHITDIKVKPGQIVTAGVTPVAVVRHLPFVSTINRYVPASKIDHVHIQVNLDTYKAVF
jgi:hypothetical protein